MTVLCSLRVYFSPKCELMTVMHLTENRSTRSLPSPRYIIFMLLYSDILNQLRKNACTLLDFCLWQALQSWLKCSLVSQQHYAGLQFSSGKTRGELDRMLSFSLSRCLMYPSNRLRTKNYNQQSTAPRGAPTIHKPWDGTRGLLSDSKGHWDSHREGRRPTEGQSPLPPHTISADRRRSRNYRCSLGAHRLPGNLAFWRPSARRSSSGWSVKAVSAIRRNRSHALSTRADADDASGSRSSFFLETLAQLLSEKRSIELIMALDLFSETSVTLHLSYFTWC